MLVLKVISFFAISLSLTAGATSETAVLARATRLTAKGEISDPGLIASLESLFQNSSSEETRLAAAYLLTYVAANPPQKSGGDYLEFLRASTRAEKILGTEAYLRLLRQHGDNAYDGGRFPEAAEDYAAMLSPGASHPCPNQQKNMRL